MFHSSLQVLVLRFLFFKIQLIMKQLGLLGYPLGHSFSKKYFNQKFDNQGISDEWHYELFSIDSIQKLPEILRGYENRLVGLNVTIPYKTAILPFLDALAPETSDVGAVNCIKISWNHPDKKPHLTGYNTDVVGFEKSLLTLLGGSVPEGLNALILGTGGAGKAVAFTFKKLNIPFKYVSRTRAEGVLSYEDLDKNTMKAHRLIVNSTPLGTSPNTEGCPNIPFQYIDNQHFILDLIYNPEITKLMRLAEERGAKVQNGMEMLIGQAEEGWRIWNV